MKKYRLKHSIELTLPNDVNSDLFFTPEFNEAFIRLVVKTGGSYQGTLELERIPEEPSIDWVNLLNGDTGVEFMTYLRDDEKWEGLE